MTEAAPDPTVEELLAAPEHEDLEFKEAKSQYSTQNLQDYASGLSNGVGGRLVLGISDGRPRQVVGSQAFTDLDRKSRDLQRSLDVAIRAEELRHHGRRVVVFHVAKHRTGVPTGNGRGGAKMRINEELTDLSEERRREIYAEAAEDFSAKVCPTASIEDLVVDWIEEFRTRWVTRLSRSQFPRDVRASQRRSELPAANLLKEAGLLSQEGLTYAALILFASSEAMGRHLSNAEVIFEYRSDHVAGPAANRANLREGVFGWLDDLWGQINLRNDLQSVQENLFRESIPTFQKEPTRELILNAVAHRDYTHPGSVQVVQRPHELRCQSPGGLPPGVTLGNIAERSVPRNRCLAEAMEHCGLVERSGQGINLMIESSVLDTKPLPDFTGTDAGTVVVAIGGRIGSPACIRALRAIAEEHQNSLETDDYRVLHHISQQARVPEDLRPAARRLRDLGVLESTGSGRAMRFLLSRNLRKMTGELGQHTRDRGLDRAQNMALLLQHLRTKGPEGAPIRELAEVVPSLNRDQIRDRLGSLARRGDARLGTPDGALKRGQTSRWFITEAGSLAD